MTRPLIYHFDLISHLVRRDFVARYKRSVLGVLWSILSPLAQLLVLVFVFRSVIPLNIDAYPAFVLSALLPWTWFGACIGSSGCLFIHNRDLLRKPHFEPSTLIAVNTLSHLIHYLMFLPILLFVLIMYERPMTSSLLFFPVLLLIQAILTAGLSLMVATLNAFYRDIEHLAGMGLLLLFYLTPVFYRSNAMEEGYGILFALNPVAVLVQAYREIFFYGGFPGLNLLLAASGLSMASLGIGYLVYRRRLHEVFDMI
ncbi:MAG: ABC transporter permease [Desulfobacteraceae bacterium]|nr:MAG: ABC transporter permease [Desulfobacteraceae bacterium]